MPTRISAPAAARDFAIAQPYPLSSAIPAINALFPMKRTSVLVDEAILLQHAIRKQKLAEADAKFSSQWGKHMLSLALKIHKN